MQVIGARGFFVPVARTEPSCYLVFGSKLFTDCSRGLESITQYVGVVEAGGDCEEGPLPPIASVA